MCGICGEWNPSGVDGADLAARNRLQAHRGPDDAGQVVLGDVGLAMTRLSVIDLEHGQQPIANEDDSAWIVFNGEIYNHRELRRGLEARGHRFRTRSDTEVILHLWEETGDRVVDALRGMFAFAVWDARRRRLLLARDPFGQKPLFYATDGPRFLFGSEIKSVLAGFGSTPALDVEALDDYLTLRFVPSPSTMFRGIRKLPPGHVLTLDLPANGGSRPPEPEPRRYFDLAFLPKQRISERDAVHEVRERVHEAVRTHLESDVDVGAFLSGGMDSSLVVASMARTLGAGFPTFAVGVAEQDFDELPFAREVATRYDTDHHEETVRPDLVRLLPTLIRHLDEPSDPIAACQFLAAELAVRTVKVVLTGDGGDELFGGFDRYLGFSRVDPYAALPRWIRRGLLGPVLDRLPDSAGYKNVTQKARWVHRLSFHRGGRRYAEATAFFRFGEGDKTGLYTTAVAERLGGRDATACIVDAFESARADDDLDRMLHADIVTRLPEHSLMLTDRMTMAHGLESRSPFLDRPLAEFVATLPTDLKIRGGRLKHVMREAATGLLPESILRRPKQGFMFPLGYWMRGPLLPVLRRLVDGSAVVEADLFDRSAMARLVEEHVAGTHDHHVRLWMILNVEIWYRMAVLGQSEHDLSDLLRTAVESAGTRGRFLMAADGVRVAVDGHVHFHACFEASRFLDAARDNLAAVPASGMLMLTEGRGEHAFARLGDGLASGSVEGWSSRATAEPTSVAAIDRGGHVLTLVAGRQIATREGIEVLALNTTAAVPDLGDLEDTLEAVWSANAVAIIPWGFGKWWGRRGRRVREILERHRHRPLMLGDNAGRPRRFAEPALFGVARELGVRILPGSDPLPFASEVAKVGRLGCVLTADLDLDRPGESLSNTLSAAGVRLEPFGVGERWSRFVALQVGMQARKRVGRASP